MQLVYIIVIVFAIVAFIGGNWAVLMYKHSKAKKHLEMLSDKMQFDLVFENVRMKFLETNGTRSTISFVKEGKIFISADFVAILPMRNFPFKGYEKLIILCDNYQKTHHRFPMLNVYKPDKIGFSSISNSGIEIHCHDHLFKHSVFKLNILGLNKDQIEKLEFIRAWA